MGRFNSLDFVYAQPDGPLIAHFTRSTVPVAALLIVALLPTATELQPFTKAPGH